jgi:hypothetical protein
MGFQTTNYQVLKEINDFFVMKEKAIADGLSPIFWAQPTRLLSGPGGMRSNLVAQLPRRTRWTSQRCVKKPQIDGIGYPSCHPTSKWWRAASQIF